MFNLLTDDELQQVHGLLQQLDQGDAQLLSLGGLAQALRKLLQSHELVKTAQGGAPVTVVKESIVAAIIQCSEVPHDVSRIGEDCYDAGYADAVEHYQLTHPEGVCSG